MDVQQERTGPVQSTTASSRENHIQSCPWILVPDTRIISIEHPGIIRNVENGIATLGGQEALAKLAAANGNMALHLRFRPGDPMQPPIESRTVPTNNLLLKITIPKRRKKKKRTEDGVCEAERTDSASAPSKEMTVSEKLRAAKGNYKVEVVGRIEKTVRFRDMASFQWNSSNSDFINKMKDKLMDGDYEKIRSFELSKERGNPNAEILPPPTFSNTVIPHTYFYRQNPAVKRAMIDGKTSLLNFQAAPKTLTPMVHVTIAQIPTKPDSVPEYESLDSLHKECVDHLRALFEQRPIWTRRALYNNFPKHLQTLVRFSMAHVAYMWRAGPWRDTCVVYGVDPRADPKYRFYQSVFFQIETHKSRPAYQSGGNIDNSHIFDGQRLVRDGRCFQLCDVTDPLVQQLINTPNLRKTCDSTDGWYRYSTIAKIKAVMKAKILALTEDKPLLETDYVAILEQASEDEDQEAARKAKDAKEREIRAEKRRVGVRALRHSLPGRMNPAGRSAVQFGDEEAAETARGEEDVDEDEDNGEWEQELELPTSQGQVDGRVDQMMAQYMQQDDIGFEGEDDEAGFDVLGSEDDDEE